MNFPTRRTMQVAQQLYEGVDIKGMGSRGLVTYIRTDSVRVAEGARSQAHEFIEANMGKEYIGSGKFTNKKNKDIQDAHEAIRPSDVTLDPEMLKESLTPEQYKLYRLIWQRFVASQMAPAVSDTVSVAIKNGKYELKASGSTPKFDGWKKIYPASSGENGMNIPALEEGEELQAQDVIAEQKFTTPPPRFTEASLVKTLEELNIGRPSTYATIITTLGTRRYIKKEKKSLMPTQLGFDVTRILSEYFSDIVDAQFTAQMEGDLDKVEEGKKSWGSVLDEFYGGFATTLAKAEEDMKDVHMKIPDEETDIVCEKCGRNMVIKTGRYGKFLACPGFPECRNTKRIAVEMPGECPLCSGKILEKKSKKGKKFYGCEHNPTCSFLSWDPPIDEKCPVCGKTLLQKAGRGARIYCSNPECSYQRAVDPKKGGEDE